MNIDITEIPSVQEGEEFSGVISLVPAEPMAPGGISTDTEISIEAVSAKVTIDGEVVDALGVTLTPSGITLSISGAYIGVFRNTISYNKPQADKFSALEFVSVNSWTQMPEKTDPEYGAVYEWIPPDVLVTTVTISIDAKWKDNGVDTTGTFMATQDIIYDSDYNITKFKEYV